MCLSIPAQVMEILDDGNEAKVDFGGIKRTINIQLVKSEVKKGAYVLVHAGYAIQVIDERTARETIQLWKELGGSIEDFL